MSNRENKPTIGALSFVLRHKELWPANFWWSYSACTTCALGLAHLMWPQQIPHADPEVVGPALGMSKDDSTRIFGQAGVSLLLPHDKVMPEHIADMLDAVAQ